jgi:hypothetical protein
MQNLLFRNDALHFICVCQSTENSASESRYEDGNKIISVCFVEISIKRLV